MLHMPLTRMFLGALLCCPVAASCDSGGGPDGPATICTYGYTAPEQPGPKSFGQSCTDDSECAFGACILPDDPGNLLNTQFGFCSRGCECNDDTASQLSDEEKLDFHCLYPPGDKGTNRHIVPLCNDLAECQAIDPMWTECRMPESGGVTTMCHAL